MQSRNLVKKDKSGLSFEYIDRGHKKDMLFIPGWATDSRIFSEIDLMYNYIIPRNFTPFWFSQNLIDYLQTNNKKSISVLGYSLGGFIAADLAINHKELIDESILVSIRRSYDAKRIAGIKMLLKRNWHAFMQKFYLDCFSRDAEFKRFEETLLNEYLNSITLEMLLDTLDFLSLQTINVDKLRGIEGVKIIHGEYDKIAPIEEVDQIADNLPLATFITLNGSGHFPFYREDFQKTIWC